MAEATAAQGSGAPNADILKLIGEGITAALAPVTAALGELGKNQKILADTYAADQQKAAEAAKAAAATAATATANDKPAAPITLADVGKLLNEGITAAFQARDKEQASTAARNGFINEKMKGIPAAYQNQLGNDPAQWAAQEQQIRAQFKADAVANGFKFADVGSGDPGGQSGSNGGGQSQPGQARDLAARGALTKGQAAFAAGIVLPK